MKNVITHTYFTPSYLNSIIVLIHVCWILAVIFNMGLLKYTMYGGGVISEKLGTRMYGPDRVPFWSLAMAPFYLKIDLDIGCVFAKCLIHCVAGLKKALQETNGLDIGCKFASSL